MSFVRNLFWKAVTVAVFTALVAAVPGWAAVLTSPRDSIVVPSAGVGADHYVSFTTAGGVAEGETMTFTWSSDFDLGAITEDDVDVAHGLNQLTTAADCAGAEEASVSVAGDTLSVMICAGDGGAIAGGSAVRVDIGTNATNSGVGVNQIVNPASAGTYYLSIGGTFGDTGNVPDVIYTLGYANVTALVDQVEDGGDDGDPGCQDSTAPVISDVQVEETSDGAVFTWSTDEVADTEVSVGLTTSYEIDTELSTSLTNDHEVTITGLSQGTTYYYRLRSADVCSNRTTFSGETFTTLDNTAPVISDVSVTLSCDVVATVAWTTDEAADSEVGYGLISTDEETTSDSSFVTAHELTLSGLTEDESYVYEIRSSDAAGNGDTESGSLSTNEDDAPANVSSFYVNAADGGNVLTWNNPSSDFEGVRVLRCLSDYPSSEDDSACSAIYDGTDESYVDSGLENGVTYYYGAFSYDACGQFASGALGAGTPSASEEELCGDGICAVDESTDSCPLDCSVPPTGPTCGDGVCEDPESTDSCSADCPPPDVGSCGDGVCSVTESTDSCPIDCPPPTGPSCGDAVCASDESTDSCPADCPPPGGTCGDLVCDEDETTTSCEVDCPVVVPTDNCGNDQCDAGETSELCEVDCPPSVEIPPTTTVGGGVVPYTDVSFFAGDGQIELDITDPNTVTVLADEPFSILLSALQLTQPVDRVLLVLGSDVYQMKTDGNGYTAEVTAPATADAYALAITIYYADGTTETLSFLVDVVSRGEILVEENDTTSPLEGATVTLSLDGSVWAATPFGQSNPSTTSSSGLIGWYVPDGTWHVTVSYPGYGETAVDVTVTNNILRPTMILDALRAQDGAPSVLTPIVETLEVIRAEEVVQATTSVAVAAVAIGAVTSTILLASFFDLLPFLQYLFTSPFLFLWGRKRKGYGVVYNAISKRPLDLATVRLYKMPDDWQGDTSVPGRLIQSRVTDKEGRYYFVPKPGRYRLSALKVGYTFPSDYLVSVKDDGAYLDVYHGEPVEVEDENAVITANIPMDPSQAAEFHEPKAVIRRRRMRRVQEAVSVLGVMVAVVVAIIRLTTLTICVATVQVAVYFLVRRLARTPKPRNWGIVTSDDTGRPLSNVVARVFEPKYNKLLETTVTDAKGRYAFMLGPNEYYTVFEKPGFATQEIRPIDLRSEKDVTAFAQDIELSQEPAAGMPQGTSETSGKRTTSGENQAGL